MAICLANSLIARHDFVPYDQLVRYKWWYKFGYMSSTGHCFDIGAATRQSIQKFETRQKQFAQEHSIPIDQMDSLSNVDLLQQFDVCCSEDGVAGNGALMRLTPVPLFFYRSPEIAVEYSGISGRITHGDDKAYDACRYYGALIVAALNNVKKKDLLSNTFYADHKEWFGNKALHQDIMSIAQGSYKKSGGYNDGIRGKGYVVSALEAALWAFWSDDDSFEKGALNAVNLGDDTDTTAAIYGQLAGAYYGYKELPNKWVKLIYASKFVECVSSWIVYEGEKWFTNQQPSDPSNSSRTASAKETSDSSTFSNQKSQYSNNNKSTSIDLSDKSSLATIKRRAVDPSGCVGFFYDGCRDHIIKSSGIHYETRELRQPSKCLVERSDNKECQNLLQFIGFDGEQRLSLVSEIIPPMGIASVIEYPYLIDERTRILYYCWITKQDFLSKNINDVERNLQQLPPGTTATHVITNVYWGIEMVVLLRLSSNDTTVIDDALDKIKECLANNRELPKTVSFDDTLSTFIYSNTPELTTQRTLIDVYHQIEKTKMNSNFYRPVYYILRHIETLLPNNNKKQSIPIPLKPAVAQRIEQYLLRFLWINKLRAATLNVKTLELLKTYLSEQLQDADNRLKKLNERYGNDKKRLKEFILNIRLGKDPRNTIEHPLLNEDMQTSLQKDIDHIMYCFTSLKEKERFINNLTRQGFEYRNAAEYKVKQDDDENAIQRKLIRNNHDERFLCSDDILNSKYWSKFEELSSRMSNEKKSNPHLRLVYVDFTYSVCELDEMRIFPPVDNVKNPSRPNSSLQVKGETSSRPSSVSVNNQPINILLIGKSGAGKSTLINTLVNHLKFNNYKDIPLRKFPLSILIPFSRSIKSDSEEHIIRIGNSDPNEDYDHPDQSVTQQCKVYTFIMDNKKIRIIDTPGFDKPHGQNNDKISMKHILSCLTNLTHLHAICVVLKSNDEELDGYQTCLIKLFQFLGNDASNNIVFCYTKALSSRISSARRDTAMKSMLAKLPIQNISFNEQTIFTFDSSYFIDLSVSRQLMTLVSNGNPKPEESWEISKNGWNRLLNHIRQHRGPYSIQRGLQMAKSTQLEINHLVRPILETIRNNVRNLILYKAGYRNCSIELHPKPVLYPSAICYSCRRIYYRCGDFYMMSNSLHMGRSSCYNCCCSSERHIRVDYRLYYEYLCNQTDHHLSQVLIPQDKLLCFTVHLANFIINANPTTTNDPFLYYLNRMIGEEGSIYANTSFNGMNFALYNLLISFKSDYKRSLSKLAQKQIPNDTDIQDFIKKVKQIPTVKKQIDAAMKMRETPV